MGQGRSTAAIPLVFVTALVIGVTVRGGEELSPLLGRGVRSALWPTTAGLVTESDVVAVSAPLGRTTYWPRIHFRYELAGKSYEGDRVSYDWPMATSERQTRARAAAYPVGAAVEIHVDPAHPGEAVIEAGPGAVATVGWSAASVFAFAAALALAALFDRVRRAGPQGDDSSLFGVHEDGLAALVLVCTRGVTALAAAAIVALPVAIFGGPGWIGLSAWVAAVAWVLAQAVLVSGARRTRERGDRMRAELEPRPAARKRKEGARWARF